MRALHVVTLLDAAGTYGGPARVASNQSRELMLRGHSLVLTAASGYVDAPEDVHGVPARLFAPRRIPRIGFAGIAAPGMLRWFRVARTEFDIVHVHLGRDLVTLPLALVARRFGVPYVVQPHGMIAPSSHPLARPLDSAMTRRALWGAGAVLYLTEREKRDLLAVSGSDLRLEQLRNGVPEYPGRSEQRSRPEVLFAARLHARKRPTVFVEIARRLLEEGVDAQFTLIGPDEGEGDAVRAAIGDVRDIEWQGPVEPARLPERMAAASIYVLPALREPYPMAVLEAMACGIPVVVTHECGLAQTIARTGSGIVANADIPAMTAAVRTLLADRPARIRMGEQGRSTARSEFGMAAIGDQLERTYSRIAGGQA